MSDDLIWAAGILEGEGYFSYHETETTKYSKRRRKLRVRLSMTDIDIIIKFRNVFDPTKSVRREQRSVVKFKDGYKRKDTYIVEFEGEQAALVMRSVLPYMGNRRKERIIDALFKWDNNRRGPVYIPPTTDEIAESANKLRDIGIE